MVYSVPLGLVPLGKGSIKSRWLEKVDWGEGCACSSCSSPYGLVHPSGIHSGNRWSNVQTCLRTANAAKSQLVRRGRHGCSANTEVAYGWLDSYGLRIWPLTLVLA